MAGRAANRRRYGDEAEIALRSWHCSSPSIVASAFLCDIIAMLFRAVVLLAAFATGAALRVPVVAPSTNIALARQARAVLPRMAEGEETPTPEEPPAPAPPPAMDPYAPPDKFLGVFDTSSPGGALAASLIVSGAFGVLVELVKFADPNNVGDASVFGSITTIGK